MDKSLKVSKDLQDAINSDAKRLAIDAAKKRAVSQKVDYDTFKNMVLVAHLKPLQAPSTNRENGMAPAWRLDAHGQQLADVASNSIMEPSTSGRSLEAGARKQVPSTSADFAREWRRNCPSQQHKLMLLQLCGAPGLSSIFRVEMDSALLGEIILVLHEHLEGAATGATEDEVSKTAHGQAVGFVWDILEALAGAGRFTLTVRLLSGKAKGAAAMLLRALHEQAVCTPDHAALLERVQTLCCQYRCPDISPATTLASAACFAAKPTEPATGSGN